DVGVLDHGGESWSGSLGVGEHPGTADVNDVGDGTMPLPLEFKEPLLEPVVEPVEMSLGLGNQPVEALDRLPLDLAIDQVGELPVLAIDERVERDFHMPADCLDLVLTLACHLGQKGLQRLLQQGSLDLTPFGTEAVYGRGCPRRCRDHAVQKDRWLSSD